MALKMFTKKWRRNITSGTIDAARMYAYVGTWASRPDASGLADGVTGFATDIGIVGSDIIVKAGVWRTKSASNVMSESMQQYIVFGGGSATYSQSGTTVTVTQTGHGMTADQNGGQIYLVQGTGDYVTEWCTAFTYVDANTFTCISATSRTTSGNLGTNTSETFFPCSYQFPEGLLKAGDSASILGVIKAKSSANNKNYKQYYSGSLLSASGTNVTAANAYANLGPASQTYMTDSKFFTNGLASNLVTDTNRTYTMSCTLANSGDWALYTPNAFSYSRR